MSAVSFNVMAVDCTDKMIFPLRSTTVVLDPKSPGAASTLGVTLLAYLEPDQSDVPTPGEIEVRVRVMLDPHEDGG